MTGLNCVNSETTDKGEKTKHIEWSVAAVLPSVNGKDQPGLAGPVTGIINNYLLVGGGANFPEGLPWYGHKKQYQDEIYLFEKKKGSIVNASVSKQKLPEPVAYCANVMTPKGLVYIGGENEQGLSDKVVLIEFNAVADELVFSDLPALPLLLTNLSATFYNHTIYVGGGNSTEGPSDKFFGLNLAMPGAKWQSLPGIPVKISFAVMVAQSNGDHDCIYLLGGRRKNGNGISDIFNTVYQFDIKNNRWTQKQSIPFGVSAGIGVAYNADQILLLGGDKGETFSKEEQLNAAIKSATSDQVIKQLTKERIALLEAHPGFTGEVLLYNTNKDEWEKLNSLPPGSPVTTTAIKWGDDIIIPNGEIKAGVRTPKILMGKPE